MHEKPKPVGRRVVLRGAAAGGAVLPLLAACASDGGGGSGNDAGSTTGPGTEVAVSDVPVGGGTILEDELVVVTQPSEGEYKAFSAACTHQGCPVQEVRDGRITCNCHGSQFSIEDGSVVNGPATRALETKSVTVEGDSVRVS